MKFNKKILNSSLVLVIALGLGGCAINSATTTHKSNNEAVSSSQVVKHSQKKATKDGKTAVKTSAASKSSESKTSTPASAASTVTSNSQSATVNTNSASQVTTTNTQSSNNNVTTNASSTAATKTNVTTNDNAKSTATKEQEHREIQLGLGDVASWTDEFGITHHVDSDGMDRQTIAGSEEVHYQDWSGSLPSNAVVTHADDAD